MELWKDVEGFEGMYQVSNLGRVKSLKRKWRLRERILKSFNVKGYEQIGLFKDNQIKRKRVHQLVWDTFGDRKRNGHKLQIDHINNNKNDNRIENLQLLTNRQNTSKGYKLKRNNYPTGVYKHGNNYQARIWINGKSIILGTYSTPEVAAQLYQEALANLNK